MKSEAEKLTVLLVASSYPRYDGDTASVFLEHLARNIANTGVRVHVLAPYDPEVRARSVQNGVEVGYFRYFPSCSSTLAYGAGILPNIRKNPLIALQVPFFTISMFISILVNCRRLNPHVIHAHWILPTGLVAVMAGRIMRIPVITTAHGSDAFGMTGRINRKLKDYAIKYSQIWTANTIETARAAFESDLNCDNHCQIIPMGVDYERFASADGSNLRCKEKNARILLFVGRIIESKGVRYLIESLALLHMRGYTNVVLWMIGEGTGLEAIKQLVAKLDIESFVKFIGKIPNSELQNYYAASDVFVMPTLIEGQGVVILEAMAAGVPVVASRVGGIRGFIHNEETGFLVEPGNSDLLADAIELCLNNDDLAQVTENARKMVQGKYGWSDVSRQFKKLYVSIVEK